jgi:hypothetical protein
LSIKIQVVAAIIPRCIPVKAYNSRSITGSYSPRRDFTYHADSPIERKLSHSEDFADLDDDIAYQEQLYLSVDSESVTAPASLSV